MKPRGLLMIEHRLIEKMLGVVAKEAGRIRNGAAVDPLFIDAAVDFIRVYADRTHHGKEEDILFHELGRKALSAKDSATMNELVDEHRQAREKVKALVSAQERFQAGDAEAVQDIISIMGWLADFYPRHIRKEDRDFFPGTESYFSAAELDRLLGSFGDFDGKMIHEKYQSVVKGLTDRAQ
ncbi:MAG TPA: hemerythrin domain-containing protein [Spirochaetia bacterium]|nr:hemerythrin domain-containing protein [Spirochaetia bacterium]